MEHKEYQKIVSQVKKDFPPATPEQIKETRKQLAAETAAKGISHVTDDLKHKIKQIQFLCDVLRIRSDSMTLQAIMEMENANQSLDKACVLLNSKSA